MNRKTELKEEMLDEELDKQFPKGDKSRGKALVIYGIAGLLIAKLKNEKEQTISKVLEILEEIIKRRTGFKPTILDIEEAIEKVKELKGK